MEINIRRAVKEDGRAIMQLIKELALYEKAPEEVTIDFDHFIESGFGEKPVWWAFVAETAEKQVIGFALYYIRFSTWKGQRLYLEDIVVNEKYRGQSVGSLLLDRLIVEAKEKKFTGMMWQVLDWNEPAINFYNKYDASLEEGWLNASLSYDQIKS